MFTTREATEEDYVEFIQLCDKYTLNPDLVGEKEYIDLLESRGFLIGNYPKEKFIEDLKKIFILLIEGEKIIGYIRIDEAIDQDFVKSDSSGLIDWKIEKSKTNYFLKPHFEIGGLLVAEEYKHKGLGKFLLNEGINFAKESGCKFLYSFIITNPIKNTPSLLFHKRNDFIEIANSKPINLFGVKGYTSVLMEKVI